jgi:hypothetical protein
MWTELRPAGCRAGSIAVAIVLSGALGAAAAFAQAPLPATPVPAAPAEPTAETTAQPAVEDPVEKPAADSLPDLTPGTLPELGGEAGEPEPERAQRHGLLYSISTAALHDDGFVLKGEAVKGAAFLARGAVLLDGRPSARSSYVVAYEPEVEVFNQQQSNLNAFNQAGGALYDLQISRRSHFTAGGSFIKAEDPTRYLGGALLFVPDGEYQQGRVYTGIDHHWEHSAIALRVEGTATEIASWPDFAATDLRDRELAASLTLEHGFGDQTTLSLSYSYLRPELTGVLDGPERELIFDEPLQSALLTLTRRIGQHWSVGLSGGALRQRSVEITPVDSRELHPIAALELTGRGQRFAIQARLERAPLSIGFNPATTPSLSARALIPAAILPGRYVNSASAELVTLLPRGFRYRQGLWGARADVKDGGTITSWGASSRVVKAATDRLGVFGELEYYRQSGFDRKRILVGLEFGLLGPREAISLDRDTDPRRRALPETRGN